MAKTNKKLAGIFELYIEALRTNQPIKARGIITDSYLSPEELSNLIAMAKRREKAVKGGNPNHIDIFNAESAVDSLVKILSEDKETRKKRKIANGLGIPFKGMTKA
jgi:hypothetical protein